MKTVGYFQRRLFVCVFVNRITSERVNIGWWNLGGRCIVQKSQPSSTIVFPHPPKSPSAWRRTSCWPALRRANISSFSHKFPSFSFFVCFWLELQLWMWLFSCSHYNRGKLSSQTNTSLSKHRTICAGVSAVWSCCLPPTSSFEVSTDVAKDNCDTESGSVSATDSVSEPRSS